MSVGEEDHVKPALEELGQVEFWKIRIKPGKPLAYAKLNKQNGKPCAFVGLPGNPVSAFVTCHLFAATLIRAMQGQTHCQPKHSLGKAAFNIKETGKRPEFLRVKYTEQGLEPYKNQSSGVLSSVAWADALAFIPDNRQVQVGDELTIYPL